ncbi:hypothetical protein B566_EDAN007984 [Ephemera danica]|nr:hypothetical protein B566_EDAN007984 [Ephemera danica]
MSAIPSAVIISVASKEPDEIIKSIIGSESVPDPTIIEEDIAAYPWHIDTKYYTADIHLCSLAKKTIGSKEFAECVGATIINFDSGKSDCLETVESWLPFVKEFSPEVQILLCEQCPETTNLGVSRVNVQRWCVENKFELVELNPETSSDDEEEDETMPGLAVTTGVHRIVQALHAHLWPNMIMKDSLLLGSTDGEAAGGDPEVGPEAEFGSLLSRLGDLRAQVASMPNEQRLAVAEQVVMDFWKAIGGPEDELLGLEEMLTAETSDNNQNL